MKTNHDDGTTYESPVGIEKYFVGEYQGIRPYYNNVVRGRRLEDIIDLRSNDSFLFDGSEKNLAVCKVVQGMDDGGVVWRGALVALKQTRSWVDHQRALPNPTPGYGHMDMGDLREVVDYLKNWKREVRKIQHGRWRRVLIIQRVRGPRRIHIDNFSDFLCPCLCVFVLFLGLWGVINYNL